MTVRIERSVHNDFSAAEAYAMATSEQFQRKKCADAGALSCEVWISCRDDGATVCAKRRLPTLGFPSLLRKFVPFAMTSTETVEWGPAGLDGSRVGQLSVHFHGAPASMTGTVRLEADGAAASTVVIDAQFRAHVPLVGGRVERFVAPIINDFIAAEQATSKAWVAGAR